VIVFGESRKVINLSDFGRKFADIGPILCRSA
jgi:hypothetical protein